MNNRFNLLIIEDAQEMQERRKREKEEREKILVEIEKKSCCEGIRYSCNNKEDIKWISARTFYPWNIDKDPLKDPNRPLFLCVQCTSLHHEHWDEKWEDYYNGLL